MQNFGSQGSLEVAGRPPGDGKSELPRPGQRLATNWSLSYHLVVGRPHQDSTGFLHDSNSKTWFTQFSPKTTFHATHHIRIVLVPNNRFHNKALHFRNYVGCFECKLFGLHFQNQNQIQAQVLLRALTVR
ncbi:hypothetical protein P8452_61535 [Trifolium repens]|nr:hypothetical protein P8452_61535 [Trifolium repens]